MKPSATGRGGSGGGGDGSSGDDGSDEPRGSGGPNRSKKYDKRLGNRTLLSDINQVGSHDLSIVVVATQQPSLAIYATQLPLTMPATWDFRPFYNALLDLCWRFIIEFDLL